jgi:formate dehydrogenase subunit delta
VETASGLKPCSGFQRRRDFARSVDQCCNQRRHRVALRNHRVRWVCRFSQGSQPEGQAVPGIADHIRKFWDPRMKSAIFAHLDAGGAGLDPPVRDAIEALRNAA